MNVVKLRAFLDTDICCAVQILLSDDIKKTYMLPDLSLEKAKELFRRLLKLSFDQTHYVRAVVADDIMVGWINDTEAAGDSLELGWVIHPAFQNRGFATAAVRLAFSELREIGYKQVLAGAFAENSASIRVMKKAGMHCMGRTEDIEYRGTVHKCVYFSYNL